MATLTVKEQEFDLKFSVMLDRMLNKEIKEDEEAKAKKGRMKLTGGIMKVLPELIDEDIETLAQVFQIAMKYAPKDKQIKASVEEVMDAIDARMNEDDDATKIFTEVFEAIDNSAFSRKQLQKFAENMNLVKEMKSDDSEVDMGIMVKRLNNGYEKITGKVLIETEEETTTA